MPIVEDDSQAEEEYEDEEEDEIGPRRTFFENAFSEGEDGEDAEPGMSQYEAFFSVITVIIGSGIMALPLLPLKAGWVFATIAMLISAIIAWESGIAVHRAYMVYNRSHPKGRLEAYEDYVFEAAGKPGEWISRIFMAILFTGVLAAYVMLMSAQLDSIFDGYLGIRTWKIILIILFVFLSMIRDISIVAKATPVSSIAAVISCILICAKSLVDSKTWMEWEKDDPNIQAEIHVKWPVSSMALGSTTAILFGSFACVPNVPSIISGMRDPKEFPTAYKYAILVVFALYLCIMLMGHYGYGVFTQSNIVQSMSRSPASLHEALHVDYKEWTGPRADIIGGLMSILVVTNLLISCPLLMQALFASYMSLSPAKCSRGTTVNRLMRLGAISAVMLIALVIPSFMDCFGLFMSICTPVICVLLPLYFSQKIRSTYSTIKPGWVRKVYHILMCIFALGVLVIGVADSAKTMAR
eukprot:TRINITY_DN42150_c0_g1_i1.p1 TRINITY_DN42150_c0_g1~~TRINITY_DN42150_c0_g1_i1.p1  ORF type:complete len:468 (+),score=50.28 TRINITY_DN42150_c0_g1_i1:82-1485(+)